MSTAPIIEVSNLSKRYRIGAHKERYLSLRDEIAKRFHALRRRLQTALSRPPTSDLRPLASSEDFWALKDVSFSVQAGESVGIIGRNGAGKSTLLKILCQITPPTEGKVTMRGRVASLLEVGTGFHPELTGRENIILNGAILGMTRAEIRKKFDEIVAFAEVDQFIDTPVKRYSSGMYVRLAFAVAAHLDPEILVVDEVLAVGDTAFQKKCLGKMGEVAKAGRTVLFVSHNMASITALCVKALVLNQGHVSFLLSNVGEAVQNYLAQVSQVSTMCLRDRKDRQGEGKIRIVDLSLSDGSGSAQDFFLSGQQVEFRLFYECVPTNEPSNVHFGIGIYAGTGGFVTMLSNEISAGPFEHMSQQGFVSCKLKKLSLTPGRYILNLAVLQNDIMQDWIQEAAVMKVESGDFFGTGRITPASHGGVLVEQTWSDGN